MTQGQSFCEPRLSLYTNNIDWESICHWTFHGYNVWSGKSHLSELPQKSRVQKFRISPSEPPPSLNNQVTQYWWQPSVKAAELKPCVARSMTCCNSNVIGYMALWGPDEQAPAWLLVLDKSFWQLQNSANGSSLVTTNVQSAEHSAVCTLQQ